MSVALKIELPCLNFFQVWLQSWLSTSWHIRLLGLPGLTIQFVRSPNLLWLSSSCFFWAWLHLHFGCQVLSSSSSALHLGSRATPMIRFLISCKHDSLQLCVCVCVVLAYYPCHFTAAWTPQIRSLCTDLAAKSHREIEHKSARARACVVE